MIYFIVCIHWNLTQALLLSFFLLRILTSRLLELTFPRDLQASAQGSDVYWGAAGVKHGPVSGEAAPRQDKTKNVRCDVTRYYALSLFPSLTSPL